LGVGPIWRVRVPPFAMSAWANHGLFQWLAIQRSRLDVLVLRGDVVRDDGKGAPIAKADDALREERTADFVNGAARPRTTTLPQGQRGLC
jgi:hypothetical protein